MRTIRDCNVCVVGGAGFLGSHLVDHLVENRDCEVLVVDNLVAGRREFVHHKAHFLHHDITGSEDHLRQILQHGKVKYVFNYSSWPYVPDSFARPLHVFNVNANGAIKVINAAQEAGCEGILQVSSAEIYGEGPADDINGYKPEHGRINENGPIKPHSTYGAAKAAVDYYCQCAWRERKTPAIALRQFNCLGERETHPYIVPEIISQLAKQQIMDLGTERMRAHLVNPGVVNLGNNSLRDFLYAGDAVRIAVELLERGEFGGVYNLGSETGIKMYDLAKLIGKLMGFAEVRVKVDESRKRPWEIWHLQSDNTKLTELWRIPEHQGKPIKAYITPLEEALKRTIRYYEESGRKWCWEK